MSETNNYFRTCGNYYNNQYVKSGTLDVISDSDYSGLINVTADAGVADYFPCVAVEYSGNVYDTNKNTTGGIKVNNCFNCTFKVDTTFVDNNGYNGCIDFAWTKTSLGDNIFPDSCQGINYETAIQDGTYGFLGNSIVNNTGMEGFSLTLYPGTSFEYVDTLLSCTAKVYRYILAYKTGNKSGNITGVLPESVRFNTENTLSVHQINNGYDFFLNGKYFASFTDETESISNWGDNEGYFTASAITTPYIETNIQIIDINNEGDDYLMNEHIKDNSIHLTREEKLNLNNLGVSVKFHNAVGDGTNDDTDAFVEALLENRRVYVPGGTYRITGELVVRDNCELELAQDAVLEFDFSGTASDTDNSDATESDDTSGTESASDTTITEEGLILWEDNEIKSAKKCITLNMLSSLVGNHATIRVPYDFDGIVVYASTRSHPNSGTYDDDVLPFERYDPQWKPARYLKDINIVKPIEQNKEYIEDSINNSDKKIDEAGLHRSINGECNGIAIFVEGYRGDDPGCSSFIWGLEYTGLRIAGAFEYGIYGTNNYNESKDDWAWTNDMKINGIIDGCECGVLLDNCNYAYISTLIQPRAAVNNSKYAKYGIFLKECQYVDLTGSRVWDWDTDNALGAPLLTEEDIEANKIYQHIGLKGNCKGLMLDDYYYYRHSDFNIRDLIYNDYTSNYDNMTILQEPVSKFFNREVVDIEESNDGDEEVAESGSDPEPVSKIKGRLFVDRAIDEVTGELITSFGTSATSMISCDGITEITGTGFDFNGDDNSTIAFYGENYNYIRSVSAALPFVPAEDDKYFRISCKTDCIATIPEITVGTNTIVFPCTCLKDHIYIKANYIEGLDEKIREILETIPS